MHFEEMPDLNINNLKVKKPIIQGGMGVGISLSGLASAVANEGGIGVIYTDFQVEGQGLRFNFNPQLGIGAEFPRESKKPYFAALRLHHISNAGLDDENRGINSVVFMVGRFF